MSERADAGIVRPQWSTVVESGVPRVTLTPDPQLRKLHRYWDFDYSTVKGTAAQRCYADYAAEFRAALEEAVRIRPRAYAPVGCYLSGGIDSCSVLGLAARHHPEPIRAFTLVFDRADYDDEAQAEETATLASAEFFPRLGPQR
jgi:asparagine synthase (glutamine-hydrolysing)